MGKHIGEIIAEFILMAYSLVSANFINDQSLIKFMQLFIEKSNPRRPAIEPFELWQNQRIVALLNVDFVMAVKNFSTHRRIC